MPDPGELMRVCEEAIVAHELRAAAGPSAAKVTAPTRRPDPRQRSLLLPLPPPPPPPPGLGTRAEQPVGTAHASVAIRPHGGAEWLAHLVPGVPVLTGSVKVMWRDQVQDRGPPHEVDPANLSQGGARKHEHDRTDVRGDGADRSPASWADSITTATFQAGEFEWRRDQVQVGIACSASDAPARCPKLVVLHLQRL